jgi:hypothetical protein
MPLDAIRRALDTPIAVVPMPILRHAPLQAARLHDQVDGAAGDYA